jgi:integrase
MVRKTGQIIRRGESTWLVRIYTGRDPETGKRRYIGKAIHGGLRVAQAHLNLMLGQRDLGRNIRSSRQTLGQYLDHWLDICARPRLRAKSFRDYSSLLARYIRPRLGSRPLGELSGAEIQTLYSELLKRELSARTIRYTHAVLTSALRQAVRWKLLLANPAEDVDLPRQSRRHCTVFDVAQAKQFIKTISGHPYEALFAVAITTGMRPSEYLALTWSDFDLERGTVSVSKTLERGKGSWHFEDTKRERSRRMIKLQNWVVDLLRKSQEEARAAEKKWMI